MSLAAMAAAAALLFSGAAEPSAGAEAAGLAVYAAPDKLVPVAGGRRIHIRCMGQGSPTVILTAGAGDSGLAWRAVLPGIARLTRTCAWDRAGHGFSDPSGEPQDVVHTTRDLERALAAADVQPPYLLVGHSLGSFESLLLAFRHPRRVSGIVLVDPSVPFQYRRFRAVAPRGAALITDATEEDLATLRNCVASARGPSFRPGSGAWSDCVSEPPADYPQNLRAALLRSASRVAAVRDLISMTEHFDRSSRQLERARRRLGDIPIVVLTAGRGQALPPPYQADAGKIAAEWLRMHGELATLSTRGVSRLIPEASHYIQDERPEAVIDAVRTALAAIPAGAGLKPEKPAPASTRLQQSPSPSRHPQ